eukprot:tig00021127_g18842.t1
MRLTPCRDDDALGPAAPGADADPLDMPEDDLRCPISQKLLTDAVLTPCKHRFDSKSLKLWLLQRSKCPLCMAPLAADALREDRAFREKLQRRLELDAALAEEADGDLAAALAEAYREQEERSGAGEAALGALHWPPATTSSPPPPPPPRAAAGGAGRPRLEGPPQGRDEPGGPSADRRARARLLTMLESEARPHSPPPRTCLTAAGPAGGARLRRGALPRPLGHPLRPAPALGRGPAPSEQRYPAAQFRDVALASCLAHARFAARAVAQAALDAYELHQARPPPLASLPPLLSCLLSLAAGRLVAERGGAGAGGPPDGPLRGAGARGGRPARRPRLRLEEDYGVPGAGLRGGPRRALLLRRHAVLVYADVEAPPYPPPLPSSVPRTPFEPAGGAQVAFAPFRPGDPALGVLPAGLVDRWLLNGKPFSRVDRLPRISLLVPRPRPAPGPGPGPGAPPDLLLMSREAGRGIEPVWVLEERSDRFLVAEALAPPRPDP